MRGSVPRTRLPIRGKRRSSKVARERTQRRASLPPRHTNVPARSLPPSHRTPLPPLPSSSFRPPDPGRRRLELRRAFIYCDSPSLRPLIFVVFRGEAKRGFQGDGHAPEAHRRVFRRRARSFQAAEAGLHRLFPPTDASFVISAGFVGAGQMAEAMARGFLAKARTRLRRWCARADPAPFSHACAPPGPVISLVTTRWPPADAAGNLPSIPQKTRPLSLLAVQTRFPAASAAGPRPLPTADPPPDEKTTADDDQHLGPCSR